MLAGTSLPPDQLDDDVSYVLALGLVRLSHGELQIANPIYREVIPRALSWTQQISIHQPTEWYVLPGGALDLPKLMAGWQAFWRKDGHLAAEGFGYREAEPRPSAIRPASRSLPSAPAPSRTAHRLSITFDAKEILIVHDKDGANTRDEHFRSALTFGNIRCVRLRYGREGRDALAVKDVDR
jgi:hypothetical protein